MSVALFSSLLLLVASFFHVPPGSINEGTPVRIAGRMARDSVVRIHVRSAAGREAFPQFAALDPKRTEQGDFVVDINPAEVQAPGFEYYVEADGRAVFASPESPYFVTVLASEDSLWNAAALRRNDGKRSRARIFGEYVDFGGRTLPSVGGTRSDFDDRYYRLEADYAYSLYRSVYTIRIGGGILRADTFASDGSSFGSAPSYQATGPGLDYGFAEIRFRLGESLFLDTRGLLGASDAGFQPGGAAALLLGKPERVFVQLGGELVGKIGAEAFLRLHWDTIAGLPMSVTVALSDFPSRDRPTGVRISLDASHEFGPLTLLLRAGYQARDIEIGGATLGVGVQHTF